MLNTGGAPALDLVLLHNGCAQSLQACLVLCDPTDCNLPGSSVLGIFRQEYWSGLPFPSLRDLPNPGIKPVSPALAGGVFTTEPPGSQTTS